MILMALIAQASAVEAERAFAAQAQRGQWAAFRAFAAVEAIMFEPQPVRAHDYLAKLEEPATPIRWQPAESYVSCDGSFAANTGPWQGADGSAGYFSTIWSNTGGDWKWIVDGGDALGTPRPIPAEPKVERASCERAPVMNMPMAPAGMEQGGGTSRDRSLLWQWQVKPDGARTFTVRLWNGQRYRTVIEDRIAAAAAPKPTP